MDRRNDKGIGPHKRGLLIIAAAVCIPLVPFFIIGEMPGERWLSATDSHAWLFALAGAGLLASDILLPIPSSIVGTMLGAPLGFVAGFIATFPGLCIVAAVVCFNLVGDALRDVLDPRQRA